MGLNRPSAPYQIVDGKAKGVDLIAEWKIVDAQWYEIFAKANLSKVFRIYMKFDPGKREVRAMDEELSVSWKKGVPSLSAEASFFRGQKSSISFGTGYAFTENLAPGSSLQIQIQHERIEETDSGCDRGQRLDIQGRGVWKALGNVSRNGCMPEPGVSS